MKTFSLDGEWQLYGFEEGSQAVATPDDLTGLAITPLSASVPGNVELDLQRAGKLEDPFWGANIRKLRALEAYEWWYQRAFDLPADFDFPAVDLVCEGLDTLAEIWINGVNVGAADNALVEHRFAVGPALRPGQTNHISVRLKSAMRAARSFTYDPSTLSWEQREESLFLRKPAHCWGWDIMPRAPSAGIWRSIRLEERPENAFESLYFWTVRAAEDEAVLGVRFQVRTPLMDLSRAHLVFTGACREHTFHYDYPLEFIAGGCQILVAGARLWWPRGYGDSNLYRVTVRLMDEDRVLAEREERVGLRVVTVDRTPTASAIPWRPVDGGEQRVDTEPDPQHHFVISVNGVPIQVKGTNWVPLDAFHSRDLGRLSAALALADDLNCNMIRCWGGNVYESDAFFDGCDEKGFLVWQDFAFGCARYPQTEGFLERVRREAEAVVSRLRNHPSLALWCGDNEVDMVYFASGLDPAHNRLTREVLPQVVHRLDPYRAFIPSSPYMSPEALQDAHPFSRTPEQHLWGPRGYFKSPFYSGHTAHFIGEIGYHGCPNPESIKKFISPEKLWSWQENDEWLVHSVNHWFSPGVPRDRIALMASQVKELFGCVPGDLETFALASQITQAEAKKYFIESTRLRKWQTSGVLWWNLIDGWPQFSDAVVDYYYAKKLAYEYIRRVQQPICLLVGEEVEKHVGVVISNDSRQEAQVRYRVWQAGEDQPLLAGQAAVPANQNWRVGSLRAYASDRRLLLMEWELDGKRYGNHALLASPPVPLEMYREWLKYIMALPEPFKPWFA